MEFLHPYTFEKGEMRVQVTLAFNDTRARLYPSTFQFGDPAGYLGIRV
jgi:hypothetical protein